MPESPEFCDPSWLEDCLAIVKASGATEAEFSGVKVKFPLPPPEPPPALQLTPAPNAKREGFTKEELGIADPFSPGLWRGHAAPSFTVPPKSD